MRAQHGKSHHIIQLDPAKDIVFNFFGDMEANLISFCFPKMVVAFSLK